MGTAPEGHDVGSDDDRAHGRGLRPTMLDVWGSLARRSVKRGNDAIVLVLDVALVLLAYLIMLLARYDLSVPELAWDGLWIFLPMAAVIHVAANLVAGLYGPVWEQASIFEAQRLLAAGATATVALTVTVWMAPRLVPLSVAAIGGFIATAFFGVLRFQSRLFAFHRNGSAAKATVRILIVGAGESAGALLRDIGRLEDDSIRPVALLDDDPRKIGRRLAGVPIVGPIDELLDVARANDVNQLLLAIPTADSPLVQRVADAAAKLGIPLKVLPRVSEFVNGHAQLRDVRDLSIDDLLGRQQVTTDLAAVEALVRGKCVVVTGGGGSIGAEIGRQLARYGPSELVLLDRDETHLFDAAARIKGACRQALIDVRDGELVHELFEQIRPDLVFHAAALKHVPLLEDHATQAVATNVLGTQNVVAAARAVGVERFVFISTDKAVKPSNVMGASKRIGEQLVLTNAPEGAPWCAVRFGNVLGSRGSVVPTFMHQIGRGGPVTVTDPDVTRFFMSIPEAVQLVLQAAALAESRQIFMLDMGEPVRIVDLANRMISLAGRRPGVDIMVEFTGLRPGEKLTEELSTAEENPRPTEHAQVIELQPPLVSRAVMDGSLVRFRDVVDRHDDAGAKALLFRVADHEASIISLAEATTVPEAVPGLEHA